MPALLLACAAYLSVALPGSTLGLRWPSIRLSLGQPVGALGILLVPGIAASVASSAVTGRLRLSVGPLVAASTLLIALALGAEAFAPSMWVMTAGTVLFGVGFGALDTAVNAHAARHFGARDITLTTGTTRMVSLQVAASAVGGAAIPAGLGLLLGAVGPRLLAPSLLTLGLAMGGLYAFIRPD